MTALAGLLIGAGAMALAAPQGGTLPQGGTSLSAQDRAAIEQVVHDYILAHPEILPEAMQKLQDRQAARVIDTHRAALETPFAGAWAGAKDGDVTLVEFFDYACGYCRASVADVDKLLANDPKLRVVFRELPILGDESDEAARVSLAAARQGKFLAFHRKMYAAARPSKASIADAQKASGLDAAGVTAAHDDPAVKAEIARNIDLARTLGLSGTPSFIVGDQVLSGAVGYEALAKAVAEARTKARKAQ